MPLCFRGIWLISVKFRACEWKIGQNSSLCEIISGHNFFWPYNTGMHYLGQLSDLPLPHTGKRLRTRRKPVAQIVLCQGCCCGQTVRALPAVPLDWLKPIWKSEKLNKIVQLTVSGCLGPCDLPNVCCIVTENEQAWYGRLTTREDYGVL